MPRVEKNPSFIRQNLPHHLCRLYSVLCVFPESVSEVLTFILIIFFRKKNTFKDYKLLVLKSKAEKKCTVRTKIVPASRGRPTGTLFFPVRCKLISFFHASPSAVWFHLIDCLFVC